MREILVELTGPEKGDEISFGPLVLYPIKMANSLDESVLAGSEDDGSDDVTSKLSPGLATNSILFKFGSCKKSLIFLDLSSLGKCYSLLFLPATP